MYAKELTGNIQIALTKYYYSLHVTTYYMRFSGSVWHFNPGLSKRLIIAVKCSHNFRSGNIDLVKYLLSNTKDEEVNFEENQTPLHVACW